LPMLHATGEQVPLGVEPNHLMLPEKPSVHAQADPAFMLLPSTLHLAALQDPEGFPEFHLIVPEKPSRHSQPLAFCMLLLAMLHGAGSQHPTLLPLGFHQLCTSSVPLRHVDCQWTTAETPLSHRKQQPVHWSMIDNGSMYIPSLSSGTLFSGMYPPGHMLGSEFVPSPILL